MGQDCLQLFNTGLVKPIAAMNDDELWNFLLENEERVKAMTDFDNKDKPRLTTGALFAYPHGIEHFRKHFLSEIKEYREGVVFTLTMDFCLLGEKIYLDYWARCGYLDHADSCDVKTSDEILPPIDEDSEQANWAGEYFHLLEARHIEHIIRTMEKNFDKLENNTREDIDKIRQMEKSCLENENYNVAYIYD